MIDKIETSKDIWGKALERFSPIAVVAMVSGGDDSVTMLCLARYLKIPVDYIMHVNTGTGIPDAAKFVRDLALHERYVEPSAGTAYEDYVKRKGFFGVGGDAHSYAYHVLKAGPYRKAATKIRKKQGKGQILFLNGARKSESENRRRNLKTWYKVDPANRNNIWVNLIHWWDKSDCLEFLDLVGAPRSPVAELLHRSGECMCGTMQTQEERREAAYWFPEWGHWLDELEKEVMKQFPWKWGEGINKYHLMEINGQGNLFKPMCVGCGKK